MQTPVWNLVKHEACLQREELRAVVNLARPAEGLVEVRLRGGLLPGTRLLGVAIPRFAPGDAESVTEHYVRGADLVAAYKESANWPVQADAVWRFLAPTASHYFLAGVELIVSVRTDCLDSRPELTVQSALPGSQVLRLVDPDRPWYEALVPSPGAVAVLRRQTGPGCLVFRVPDVALSYAEMVHPADFHHDEVTGGPQQGTVVQVRHCLFPECLEKGVMLRARVRGVFLPRDADTRAAAEVYRDFAAAEPLLGA